MNKLKQSFTVLKDSVPKRAQWLLLVAAFIIVLILLTLLLRGGDDDKTAPAPASDEVAAVLTIDPDSLDWSKTLVDETANARITVSANTPVKIDAVRSGSEVSGMSEPRTTCTTIGQISSDVSCSINLNFAPTAPMDTTPYAIFIDWRGANDSENMKRTEKIAIALGAIVPQPAVIETPPVSTPTMAQEITNIADDNIFAEPIQSPVPSSTAAPVNCSDFAFAGYNSLGVQIGWIRPERGAYKFHPFSDTECNSPTGTYNPDNGIITDNDGKKIGTDAEHIGRATNAASGVPQLSNAPTGRNMNRARQVSNAELAPAGRAGRLSDLNPGFKVKTEKIMTSSGSSIVSSAPYDRTFILRQYKPIPATIVSEIRADTRLLSTDHKLPVIATVDRNVYSDNGRTIIIPTGTTLYGYVTGDVPGPYKAIGRMEVRWYQFVRPDGVEFNFLGDNMDPFSADAQGRVGVPGRGSTDYIEQFLMPMLTAIVPAAVNMIAPISDSFINQIDLDNNTVTQSGNVRSSELAKNEIITAWNKVAQKLLVDMMDNTVPPFSIAAGTRITVFSPVDLQVTCGDSGDKKCAISAYGQNMRVNPGDTIPPPTMAAPGGENAGSMIGQVRSFNLEQYCDSATQSKVRTGAEVDIRNAGLDYRTVVFYCQSSQYTAINNAKQAAVYNNQQQTGYASQGMITTPGVGTTPALGNQQYNTDVLGLTYNDDGTIQNPFNPPAAPEIPTLTCPDDGLPPDANGCCTGETYTDMEDQGFNCCPASGGDCFPPMI